MLLLQDARSQRMLVVDVEHRDCFLHDDWAVVEFFVDEVLDNFNGYAIYTQQDDQVTPGGNLLLFGKPSMPTRGVIHVHLTNAASPAITADMAIFSNLGQDDVSF